MSGGGSWKVAYADFVTALMAFFLLMWILAMVPQEKRAEIAVYFQDPGGYQSQSTIIDHNSPPASGGSLEDGLSDAEASHLAVHRFLSDSLKDELAANKIKLQPSEAGVLLRTSGGLSFSSNSAELGPEGEEIMRAVVETMRHFKVNLVIGGHTDSSEDGGKDFADKWQLSAARAAAATAYIVEQGQIPPSMIMSSSYADYRPLLPDSAAEPNPVNRRVEFFFYTPDTRPANLGFH